MSFFLVTPSASNFVFAIDWFLEMGNGNLLEMGSGLGWCRDVLADFPRNPAFRSGRFSQDTFQMTPEFDLALMFSKVFHFQSWHPLRCGFLFFFVKIEELFGPSRSIIDIYQLSGSNHNFLVIHYQWLSMKFLSHECESQDLNMGLLSHTRPYIFGVHPLNHSPYIGLIYGSTSNLGSWNGHWIHMHGFSYRIPFVFPKEIRLLEHSDGGLGALRLGLLWMGLSPHVRGGI